MSAHTEGPWWVTKHGVRNSGGYIVHTNSVQRYEGQEERYAFEVAQREADKRLIAAAPALLEALQECIADADGYEQRTGKKLVGGWPEKARAAIAAATGQAGEVSHG